MKDHPHSWPAPRPICGCTAATRRQRGAFIITFALALLFLLGFMGIALDFGRLFVVKSEIQTAMDSCALAAARELNGQGDAIDRARSAGIASGNGNNTNLQSANWNGQGKLTATDISFSQQDYVTPTLDGTLARYAECKYTMSGLKLWLLQSMGAFTGDSATWPNTGTVGARAVATRGVAQSSCPIPVRVSQAKFQTLKKGDWVVALTKSGNSSSDFGWSNLDGTNSAKEAKEEMDGKRCRSEYPKLPIKTNGVDASVFEYWNYRFGLDKDGDPTKNRPDFTGYAYTPNNWNPLTGNAYPDFVAKRQIFAPCNYGASDCDTKNNEVVANATQLQQYGADRRMVLVPVVDGDGYVVNFACMLMLRPIPQPVKVDIHLEFRGNASDLDSPCTTTGLAGGINGPLVPVLVR